MVDHQPTHLRHSSGAQPGPTCAASSADVAHSQSVTKKTVFSFMHARQNWGSINGFLALKARESRLMQHAGADLPSLRDVDLANGCASKFEKNLI